MKCKGEILVKGKNRKAQKKNIQINEITKISMQEVDEEKWIHMQAEAYYRAMKRIEAEKDEKPVEAALKINRLYRILYVLNFLVFPFKIFGKVKLKEAAYNMPIVYVISIIMRCVGFTAWLTGLILIPHLIITGELPFNIFIVPLIIILVFIGSMLIIGAREFEKEEDNNQIYAFSATFLALVSLCVSIVSLLR